jgi:hypothetical protein
MGTDQDMLKLGESILPPTQLNAAVVDTAANGDLGGYRPPLGQLTGFDQW